MENNVKANVNCKNKLFVFTIATKTSVQHGNFFKFFRVQCIPTTILAPKYCKEIAHDSTREKYRCKW